ncbi:serine/threonine-protein kinase Chk1-like [Lineus longissimus]|uniref:serine/threonine-protein kinase Chk1-like n=1 Tax=Lineus longissimus TaxID=88925 RepID=UPI002B4EAA87
MVTPFVEDWNFVQVLGEGAYGEVKLAVNVRSEEAVAVKIIDLSKVGSNAEAVRKETIIHKLQNHDNIIKFYGHRTEDKIQYLYLEYASGGELFDRIEPDSGMPEVDAQRFFKQLMSGVEYLHTRGVAHRDLKPENLLLDENDNLKITDFGLATMFRIQGVERKLERCCGTVPYVAPEVILAWKKAYQAEPADIWSCGIILVALLAGELPWDEPTTSCQEYNDWKECKITITPWSKINNLPLSLLRKILTDSVSKRANMSVIKKHQWFTKNFKAKGRTSSTNSPAISDSPFGSCGFKRVCSGTDFSPPPVNTRSESGRVCFSQPEPRSSDLNTSLESADTSDDCHRSLSVCFSQPAHTADHMLLSSQALGTQGSSQTPMQRLVKRMTRFFVTTDTERTIKELHRAFDKLGYTCKTNSLGQITMTTLDRRKMNLTFKVCLIDMGADILLDFRLSKGDGIEFKRHFLKIKARLANIISSRLPTCPMFFTQQ